MQNGAFSNLIGMPSDDIREAHDAGGRIVAKIVIIFINLRKRLKL